MLPFAHAMVGKCADDITILDRMTMAMGDDTFQLMLELFEAGDFFAHMGEVFGGNAIRTLARHLPVLAERDQFSDGVYIEPDIAGMADESQPFEIGFFVTALVAFRAVCLADEAHLLIIADRRNLHAGTFGQFTDGQHCLLHILKSSRDKNEPDALVSRDIAFQPAVQWVSGGGIHAECLRQGFENFCLDAGGGVRLR